MRLLFTYLACVFLGGMSVNVFAQDKVIFEDDFNHSKKFEKNWFDNSTEEKTGKIEYKKKGGIDNSGCVKISNPERGAIRIMHSLNNLEPGKLYRMSAMMKCVGVKEGRGAVIYLNPDGFEQGWNASKFVYDDMEWSEIYMDFVPNQKGEATICCALGFPWGTYNGGKALGEVYYDNVRVEPIGDKLYHRESKHFIVSLDKDKVTITDKQMDRWLANLDRTYEAYKELLGGTPYGGRKIMILNTPGIEPGYWALAGNPILWNNKVKVTEVIERAANLDDWGFGILHEIGHNFSARNMLGSGMGGWNWNDEIFANFRMSYAIEVCQGAVSQRNIIYRGADIINYYQIFYDETIGSGVAKNNGDALHYTFLRIKDKYGWDVYKKAFRTLYAIKDADLPEMKSSYEKFLYFLSHVSTAAGEDVTKTCYTPEELNLIERSLEK